MDEIEAHTVITGHRHRSENWVKLSSDRHLKAYDRFILFRNIPDGRLGAGGNGDYKRAQPFIYDYENLVEFRAK